MWEYIIYTFTNKQATGGRFIGELHCVALTPSVAIHAVHTSRHKSDKKMNGQLDKQSNIESQQYLHSMMTIISGTERLNTPKNVKN